MDDFRRVVFVCRRCGCGFLRYPGRVHPEAVWTVGIGDDRVEGEDCFGEVAAVDVSKLTVDTKR